MSATDTLPSPLPLPHGARELFYAWHGGQGSALYSAASCDGVVKWSTVGRLACELSDAAADARGSDDATVTADAEPLAALAAWAEALAELNPYAAGYLPVPDPGSYMLAAVTDDGGTLCERCTVDPSNPCHPSADGNDGDGWAIAGWSHSGEVDGQDWCDHCGREWTGHEPDDDDD